MNKTTMMVRTAAVLAIGLALTVPLWAQQSRPESYADWAEIVSSGGAVPLIFGSGALGAPPAPKGSTALTFYSDRATFQAAAPALPFFEDFEEGNVASGQVANCADPVDSSSSDTCFSPGDIEPGMAVISSSGGGMALLGANVLSNPSKVIGANFFSDTTSVTFSNGERAVGMDVYVNLASEVLNVNIFTTGDVLIGSTTVATSGSGAFFGVISDTDLITRIEIVSPSSAGELLDDVEYPVELTGFSIE